MEEFMDKETCVAFYEDAKVNARHSRIEARFERLLVALITGGATMNRTVKIDHDELWAITEQVESFLQSKRAEVK